MGTCFIPAIFPRYTVAPPCLAPSLAPCYIPSLFGCWFPCPLPHSLPPLFLRSLADSFLRAPSITSSGFHSHAPSFPPTHPHTMSKWQVPPPPLL